MTLGQDRVRSNAHDGELVTQIKLKVAELIDLCEQHKTAGGTEAVRHWSLAQTCFEDGSHWAAKAATSHA